jgi:hypothetical protein
MGASTTERFYLTAQEAFRVWCRGNGVRFPASHEDVAAYLRHAAKVRGPTVVPVHLSAIARLYRAAGRPLDTKAPVIQRVVKPARDRIRATCAR